MLELKSQVQHYLKVVWVGISRPIFDDLGGRMALRVLGEKAPSHLIGHWDKQPYNGDMVVGIDAVGLRRGVATR